jgi:hypothetical protein
MSKPCLTPAVLPVTLPSFRELTDMAGLSEDEFVRNVLPNSIYVALTSHDLPIV